MMAARSSAPILETRLCKNAVNWRLRRRNICGGEGEDADVNEQKEKPPRAGRSHLSHRGLVTRPSLHCHHSFMKLLCEKNYLWKAFRHFIRHPFFSFSFLLQDVFWWKSHLKMDESIRVSILIINIIVPYFLRPHLFHCHNYCSSRWFAFGFVINPQARPFIHYYSWY